MARNLKPADKVVMINCAEARLDKYKDKVWEVDSDLWMLCDSEVVLLRGFRGGFATKCLKKARVS